MKDYSKITNKIERTDLIYSDVKKLKSELNKCRRELFDSASNEKNYPAKIKRIRFKIEAAKKHVPDLTFSKSEITKAKFEELINKKSYILSA
jgi:septal ring factor EnvC (AmiA/AmiB activator)